MVAMTVGGGLGIQQVLSTGTMVGTVNSSNTHAHRLAKKYKFQEEINERRCLVYLMAGTLNVGSLTLHYSRSLDWPGLPASSKVLMITRSIPSQL